jgi:murein DD-endopeptidase MepM/ murein hydrolase activator NlpD
VEAGDPLAHVGNAGGTSEPHLHFGYLKKPDVHGRADMFPIEFTNLKDGSKKVDGTVSTGDYTS